MSGRLLLLVASALIFVPVAASAAQEVRASECLAMAQALPKATYVNYKSATKREEVTITYAGHSTYVIETPAGLRIATDYSGVYSTGGVPDIVTMNKAHSTHYTFNPDPRIKHVLNGWGDTDDGIKHSLAVEDVLVRNVPTDIRNFAYGYGLRGSGELEKNANSIFIFEVAGLCIGHLGHLHHPLDETHFAAIGRLDVVMVPIDGTYTMSLQGMSEIVRRLRSSVVLPMHRFGTPLQDLLGRLRGQFELDLRLERSLKLSIDTLPKTTTVIVLDGV